MKDYQFFEVNDFLDDAAFRRWVFSALPKDDEFWKQWLLEHPEKETTVTQARQQLLDIRGNLQPLSVDYIDQKVAQIVRQAQEKEETPEIPLPIIRRFNPTWYYLAASIALLLGFGWIYQSRLQSGESSVVPTVYAHLVESANQPLLEVGNTSNSPKSVTLPDGSTVMLYKNSRVSYPKQFAAASREVYLTGQAFFQVQKNPKQPFLVYANELVTKVLGTSFFVKAYDQDKDVLVTVRTGKVSVFAQTDKQATTQKASRELGGMILTPNQQAMLIRANKRLIRSLVAEPQRVDGPQKLTTSFVFKQTPIREVFASLERTYGVRIIFDENLMAHCTLTARLDDESLYKKLDWICAGTESSYEEVDGQIIITGKGCQ
ncbi:FecR family protein [Spirosoma validum]|uniref:FecR family protein n=1 Tax=Spirosoma validum TaxID=2771355 RepID=A0A927GFN7_9BACT|nr:FecR family protein [Spirosoma validum]MBD2755996.1 FecR family protein [Spirosoma validum]